MTKKIIALLLFASVLIGILSGCGMKNDKITVLCTVFPIYDWVRNVVGDSDKLEVKLLVSDGADLHSFQPTARDAIDIKTADLVVRVGGADDSFVNELTKDTDGIDLRLIDAEGVTKRHVSVSSEHEHSHGEGHDHKHPTDEHIWLSLKNGQACIEAIYNALADIDPQGAEGYRQNADEYIERLIALDLKYAETVASVSEPRLVFADRFPFIYLTEDYGIEFEAAFEGCTTDAEAGFDTVIRLASKVEQWGLSYVCVTESSDKRLSSSVADAVEGKAVHTAVLDSMQSVTKKDIAAGQSYIGIMEKNLSALTEALSK